MTTPNPGIITFFIRVTLQLIRHEDVFKVIHSAVGTLRLTGKTKFF